MLVVEGFVAGNAVGGGGDLLEEHSFVTRGWFVGMLGPNGDIEDEDERVGDWRVEMVEGQNIQFSGSCCDRVT